MVDSTMRDSQQIIPLAREAGRPHNAFEKSGYKKVGEIRGRLDLLNR